MTLHNFARGGLLCAAVLALPISAQAQASGLAARNAAGKQIFDTYCAVCHNTDGKGSGPFAGELTQKLPDLTMIQKKNNGMFPFGQLYDMIDGRQMVAAHGTRDMPIWGDEFNDLGQAAGPFGTAQDYAVFTMGRIVAVIEYIRSIQAQ